MAEQQRAVTAPTSRSTARTGWGLLRGGVAGNARLTALAGMLLLVLLAAEGFTVFNVRALLAPHVFIGLMLLPPIALKLASTGYRFAAYYIGNRRYRAAGPPHPFPRILAPVLVVLTVFLFGSGIATLVSAPGHDSIWRSVHSTAFFIWFFLMAAHVLIYLFPAGQLAAADLGRRRARFVPGALDRGALLAGSVLLGVIVAIAFLPLDSAWLQWASHVRPHG